MRTKDKSGAPPDQPTTMRLVKKEPVLTRRSFLKGSGLASIGVTVLSTSVLLGSSSDAHADAFVVLKPEAGKVLLKMARDIYPHDQIPDTLYLQAVAPYDAMAGKDAKLKNLILDGIVLLNATSQKTYKLNYIDIPKETDRVVVLKQIEETPFFQKIRGDMVTGLYNNKAVYPLLGYEGSSWEKGGYINRGFNDIDWL